MSSHHLWSLYTAALSSRKYGQAIPRSDEQAVADIDVDAFASNVQMLLYWSLCIHRTNSLQMLQETFAMILPGKG